MLTIIALQVVGRFIVGFGVSLSAIAECIYISEIAPAVSTVIQNVTSHRSENDRGAFARMSTTCSYQSNNMRERHLTSLTNPGLVKSHAGLVEIPSY